MAIATIDPTTGQLVKKFDPGEDFVVADTLPDLVTRRRSRSRPRSQHR
jgi:hypothetical protein